MAARSAKGVFVDTKSGDVVEGKPEEGVQLVAPGAEIGPLEQQAIDQYGGVPGLSVAPDPVTHPTGVFFDTQAKTVTAEKPAEGIQLVAPGGEWTAEACKEIELHGGDPDEFAPTQPEPTPAPEPAPEPQPEPQPEPVAEPQPEA